MWVVLLTLGMTVALLAMWLVVDALAYTAQWQRALTLRVAREHGGYNRALITSNVGDFEERMFSEENDADAMTHRNALQGSAEYRPVVGNETGAEHLVEFNRRFFPQVDRLLAWLKTSRDTVDARQVLGDFTPTMAWSVLRRQFVGV